MKKKNEKMTIDKLAELTQMGFETLGFEMESKMESEINGLRGEMKSEIGGLRYEMKDEISGLRDKLKDEMREKFDLVLTGQDQILKRLENLETDNTMDTAVHRRHEDKLENHEKRIVVVENKVLA